ncbi:MAG: RNA-binding S4 domain-containing protein [Clostridiales bacterium]|nr:MAG: RNA-binding S4 domain-containing protein [Clostridiales bacterium]
MSEAVFIGTDFIRLDAFLKLCGAATTGGEAKLAVGGGLVLVNGEVCTARGRKLRENDEITYENAVYTVRKWIK